MTPLLLFTTTCTIIIPVKNWPRCPSSWPQSYFPASNASNNPKSEKTGREKKRRKTKEKNIWGRKRGGGEALT